MFPSKAECDYSGGYGDFKLLHRGSYADIYRASKAGKYFLMKAVREGNPQHLAMLRREYELSIGLDNPNIVRTFTFENNTEVGPSMVMEYVDGQTLSEFIKTSPSRSDRRKHMLQLLDAVAYIHSKGIVHNDIKPENIMVTANGNNIKVIDFGFSDDEAHYLITTPGCTAEYAAPELTEKGGKVDQRSDIYSLGIIISQICRNRYKRIASKCRRHSPDQRYRNVNDVQKAIHRTDAARIYSPIAAAAVAVLIAVIPKIDSRLQYENVVTQINKMYNDSISAHSIEECVVPYFSYKTYMEAGSDKTSRRDTLVNKAENRLKRIVSEQLIEEKDQKIRNEAEKAFDMLFRNATEKIERQHYRMFGMQQVTFFSNEFTSKRDSCVDAMTSQTNKDNLYAHSEKIRNEMIDRLYTLTDKLPEMTGLDFDEANFYSSLIFNGEPYRPYRKAK